MLLTQADLESASFAKQTELCFVAFLAKQSLRRSLKQMHISYPSIQKRALGKFWLHCIMLNTVMIPSCHWAVFSDCQWKYSSCYRPPDKILNFRNGCCIRRVLLRVSIVWWGYSEEIYVNDTTPNCNGYFKMRGRVVWTSKARFFATPSLTIKALSVVKISFTFKCTSKEKYILEK